ncbi:tetratricopeptide repeat protein [Citreimonas sp.]|uniref:tetratricopeptide repeat protein n=1 Tax=Citreimonas sp. TaxID=3036715 RepID=UPI00405825CA
MKRIVFALVLLGSPALADGCPEAPDHDAAISDLLQRIQAAPDEAAARPLNGELWELWLDAPDEPSQAMLDQGMRARSSFDYLSALDRFDALVSYCPFYAEGYNQRAFINFLREDYAAALPDLDRTLEIDPRHVGALSGRALTLMALGRPEEGQAALRAALALNPWLAERALLVPVPERDL